MKRLEEILEKAWSKNTNNEPLDEKYIGETKAIHEAMKLYAREVAQASLDKAAENAVIEPKGMMTRVDKESITDPNNITLL
ncbi:hypothetical protein J2O09_05525 [Elizabethkingia anophelis]|uniref:hypothetical protein n=1 Tax=Elizabethkingia anophelis TaxID=1117645 RepID=UPI0020B7CAD1|nr:hypothetical protein [Elizabethkingia anophelis]UTG62416.1 hypothetical protein J2O09_05525 [Elizabethkingia anophelis]UXM68698.1 hypothetical protein N7E57_05535 [Elizabethkingia anophelis]